MQTPALEKKKKKKRNLFLDWLGYIALRLLIVFLYLFSIDTNLKTAVFLGKLFWRFYPKGRKRALENLRASFPDKPESWIWQTGQRSFEQLVMLVIDMIFTPRLVKRYNWRQYCVPKNIERIKWMLLEEKGILMVTAHYGNFEILGNIMGLFGFKNAYTIARPLDNKFISNYLYSVRQRTGHKIIDKKGASVLMDSIIAQGATIGFIADQDAGKKGIFVDFFGRPASTYKSIGLLAITNNMPIVVGCTRRIGDRFFFQIEATRLIMPAEWADKPDPLRWVTQEFTKAMEDFIRQEPTQYWWLHRRWKHQPKPRAEKKSSQISTVEQSPLEAAVQ